MVAEAIAIGAALYLTSNNFNSLAAMSTVVAAAACAACVHMHKLYSSSMWRQIQGRELRLAGAFEMSAEHLEEMRKALDQVRRTVARTYQHAARR